MAPLFMCFIYIFQVEIGGDRFAFSHIQGLGARWFQITVPNQNGPLQNLDRMTRHQKKWSDRLPLDVLAIHGRHGVLTLSSDFPFRHLRRITMHHAAARRITPNPRIRLIDPVI